MARCAARLAGTGSPTWETDNGLGGPGCAGLYAIPFGEARLTTLRVRSDRNHNGRIAGRGNTVTSPASAADRGEEDVLYALSTVELPAGRVPVHHPGRRDGGRRRWWRWRSTASRSPTTPRPNFGPCAGVASPCDIAFSLPLTSQAQADNIGRIRISVQAQQQTAGQTGAPHARHGSHAPEPLLAEVP